MIGCTRLNNQSEARDGNLWVVVIVKSWVKLAPDWLHKSELSQIRSQVYKLTYLLTMTVTHKFPRIQLDPDPHHQESDEDPESGAGGHGHVHLQRGQRVRQHASQGGSYRNRWDFIDLFIDRPRQLDS